MFIKIFKYDFIAIFKKLIPVFIALPVLSIFVRIVNSINYGNDISVLTVTSVNGLFLFLIVASYIACGIIVLFRYVKSFFKDQGYLTHTLPVGKNSLILSIVINTLLAFIATSIIIFISIVIAYYSNSIIDELKNILQSFEITYEGNFILDVLYNLVLKMISSIETVLLIFLGIALGYSHNKNKAVMSVVYCLVLSFGISFFENSMNLVFSNIINSANMLNLIKIIEDLIVIGFSYFFTVFTLNKGLNLE